jgi:hypothetical protein
MTDPRNIHSELEQPMSTEEREAVVRLAERLEHERPVPRAAFRGELRRSLLGPRSSRQIRPERLRVLVASYSGSGLVLLLVAGLGVAGSGPFSAG